jgi:IMP dehydrogenase/GMP reductase
MPKPPVRKGYSFDDVLLVPKRTRAASRRDVDVSSELVPGCRLRIPFLSANIPWCTEADMAIAMARLGGLGFVHRMCLPEQEADMVRKVKTAPVLREEFPDALLDSQGRLLVGAAVGVREDVGTRARLLVDEGADLLLVDVAHGHADQVVHILELLKKHFPQIPVVAGNVATREGTADLIKAGADAIKVGIGPGSVCTTRTVAGAGVPQLTAVLDCAEEAGRHGIPVIADGGIRTSGDVVKALAAGACCVMLGRLLAGTKESSAILVEDGGELFKTTTGFVTLGVQLTMKRAQGIPISRSDLAHYNPEGVEASFPYSGDVKSTLQPLIAGLRSGISYSGALSVPELQDKAEFIEISLAGYSESQPHALSSGRQVHADFASQLISEPPAGDAAEHGSS